MDMDAKPSSDVNVTVRSRSPNKVEQITVVSGNEEIGSSMQRIASNLMQASDSDRSCNKEVVTTSELPVDDSDRPGDFEDWISRRAAEYGAWQFCKFNGVFCEAELIHLECYHWEIHLYQLFFELVCSTDIV